MINKRDSKKQLSTLNKMTMFYSLLSILSSMIPTASKSGVTPRLPRGMISAEVQTTLDGLYYSWDTMGAGMSYPGVPYGLHFVDPTPIAAHVVSSDALEGM